jgi:hypothetical protein
VINPKHYLNTASGDRIPVYAMEVDWAAIGLEVLEGHPNGGQIMSGDGIVWLDGQGRAVAIAGEPDSRVMSLIRDGKRIQL